MNKRNQYRDFRTDNEDEQNLTGRLFLEGLFVWVAVFVPLVFAANQLALGWDEGYTLSRIDSLRPWVHGMFTTDSSQRARLFQPAVIQEHWRFSKEEPDGHGPFYALLSLAGYEVSHRWLAPPLSYRLGPLCLFSVTVAFVYTTLRRCWVLPPCLLAAFALATMPRLVPEVCYALVDGPLLSLTLLTWCGFVRGAEGGSWIARVGFGVAMGTAMATKLTGWFLFVPYVAWVIWAALFFFPADRQLSEDECRERRTSLLNSGVWTLLIGLTVAPITVFAWNVGWWHDPVAGVETYFRSNLTRANTIPISIQFLGTRYPFSLPWYNTIVWTLVAVPVGTLTLGVGGLVRCLARFRTGAMGILLALNWGLIMVVRALPQAPGHDGTRQIIISFGFLALLAGYGFEGFWKLARQGKAKWLKTLLAGLVGVTVVGESAFNAGRYHPYQLSYYSPIVGGLKGATKLGFEPTYFWDSLTPDVLAWLESNTKPDEWVLFRNNPESFEYLRRWNQMKFAYRPGEAANPRWVVYQHRPGLFLPADDWLMENGTPAFRKELMGVPILSIYPIEQFQEAQRINPGIAPQASQ